jgi:hypothetical protein
MGLILVKLKDKDFIICKTLCCFPLFLAIPIRYQVSIMGEKKMEVFQSRMHGVNIPFFERPLTSEAQICWVTCLPNTLQKSQHDFTNAKWIWLRRIARFLVVFHTLVPLTKSQKSKFTHQVEIFFLNKDNKATETSH